MANVIVDLATSLVQTFTIVFLGYVFGRMQIVTKAQADGIGIFTSALSLPALLFRSMVMAMPVVGYAAFDEQHMCKILVSDLSYLLWL